MSGHEYLFHLILHSADLLDEELTRRLRPLGIGPRQARVIEGLSRMGEVSQARLSREFRITQASMSTMTSRLVKGGYITRRPDPGDTRGKLLSLTAEGSALLDRITAVWASMDDHGAELIGRDRFRDLIREAGALRDAMGGTRPGG